MARLIKPQKFIGTVQKITQLSQRVKIFTFGLDRDGFDFVPGQNVVLSIDGNVNDSGAVVKRVYSIASAPGEPLELCIAILPNGALSAKLDQLKVGDKLNIEGPHGFYRLRENAESRVNFVAGGTGIAPFISMIRHLRKTFPATRITLYFGFREVEDFLYREELESFARDSVSFRLFTSASSNNADWPTKGRITEVLSSHLSANKLSSGPVYICGPKGMVLDVRKLLGDKGFPSDGVIYEEW